MTRRRKLLGAAIVLLLAVYAFGPPLLAPQSDRASTECADQVDNDSSAIRWRLFPLAGWVCEDSGATKSYLGWWA